MRYALCMGGHHCAIHIEVNPVILLFDLVAMSRGSITTGQRNGISFSFRCAWCGCRVPGCLSYYLSVCRASEVEARVEPRGSRDPLLNPQSRCLG
jgi:hypothetical protein